MCVCVCVCARGFTCASRMLFMCMEMSSLACVFFFFMFNELDLTTLHFVVEGCF